MGNVRTDTVGVVLAGGASSRMGQNKALLQVGEQTLIERAVQVLSQMFHNVIISANEPAVYNFLGLPVVKDVWRDCGPLAGIHASLLTAGLKDIFVLSCDLPFVDASVIERILRESGGAEVVVAGAGTRVHPLCGVYRNACLKVVEGQLRAKEFSVVNLVRHMKGKVIVFGDDGVNRFVNINTPVEYNTAVTLLKSP